MTNLTHNSFFCYVCLQSSACFEQPCAHHQENQMCQYDIWYMSLWKQVICLKLRSYILKYIT